MKNFLKNNLKTILTISSTAIICISGAVFATTQYYASNVIYKDGKNVEQALNELYNRIPNGTMNFTRSNTNGFTSEIGEVDFCSYGVTPKTFSSTTENSWNVIKYSKQESKTLNSKFEISMQLSFNNGSARYMGYSELLLYKNNSIVAQISISDGWGAVAKTTMVALINDNTIGAYTASYNCASGRYSIVGDGEKVYFYWGEALEGSINYNNTIEYDKIEFIFKKYPGYSVNSMYIEDIYIGNPLFHNV